MKNKHKRRANGFGLVETLLTLGALSALSLGIYLVLSPASAATQAKREPSSDMVLPSPVAYMPNQ